MSLFLSNLLTSSATKCSRFSDETLSLSLCLLFFVCICLSVFLPASVSLPNQTFVLICLFVSSFSYELLCRYLTYVLWLPQCVYSFFSLSIKLILFLYFVPMTVSASVPLSVLVFLYSTLSM